MITRKRLCELYPAQDGVCGCPNFWKKTKKSKRTAESKTAPVPGDSVSTPTVTKDGVSEESALHMRERQDKEEAMPSSITGEGVATKSRSQRKNAQKKRKKERENRLMREKEVLILIDYELPSGDDRLSWDTDEVRRMAGEIA